MWPQGCEAKCSRHVGVSNSDGAVATNGLPLSGTTMHCQRSLAVSRHACVLSVARQLGPRQHIEVCRFVDRTSCSVGSGTHPVRPPCLLPRTLTSSLFLIPSPTDLAAMLHSTAFNPLKGVTARSAVSRRGYSACRSSASEHGLTEDRTDTAPTVSSIAASESDLIALVQDSAEQQWLSRPVGGVATGSTDRFVPVSKLADAESIDIPQPGLVDRIMASAPVLFYMRNLEKYPLSTKCWTSFTGFFIGDVVAQALTEPEYALSRTLILAGYGFFIDAPAGNAFYVRPLCRHRSLRVHTSRPPGCFNRSLCCIHL